jgi:hypothetical protein
VPGGSDPPGETVNLVECHVFPDQLDPQGREPCRFQEFTLLLGAVEGVTGGRTVEEPRPRILRERLVRDRDDRRGVASPAHLEEDPSPRPESAGDTLKDPAVVGDPVQGSVREDDVELFIERQVEHVPLNEAEIRILLRWEALPGEGDHVAGYVKAEYRAGGEAGCNLRGHLPLAASEIEHPLIAGKRELCYQFMRPGLLGGGVPVVVARVPRVCHDVHLRAVCTFSR